jgi:hypothetical protein
MDVSAKESLAVYHNPFSNATENAKIPDGKAVSSIGQAFNSVGELSCPSDQGTVHLVLFAGKTGGLCYDFGQGSTYSYRNNVSVVGYNTAGNISGISGLSGSGDHTFGQIGGAASWRVVSQGLQLKLLNPEEENDGWYECWRFHAPRQENDYMWLPEQNGDSSSTHVVAPVGLLRGGSARFENGNTTSYYDEASYSSGLLKDLHHIQFELANVKDYNDFERINERMVIEGDSIVTPSLNDGTTAFKRQVQFQNGHDDARSFIDQWVDNSYDMVVIRIHPRQDGASATTPTRLWYHLRSNQELQYGSDATENRFETAGQRLSDGEYEDHHAVRNETNRGAADFLEFGRGMYNFTMGEWERWLDLSERSMNAADRARGYTRSDMNFVLRN